ncbi:hypothetical protein ACIQUZ_34280 [Streptomyces griseus]|nr:hypothetical protein [Streptomyces sp. OspMP-M43]SCD69819.1 hypothetical protein GA0115261_101405 [Streptomyces sp. OspMP-M43]
MTGRFGTHAAFTRERLCSGGVLLYRIDPDVGFVFGKGAMHCRTRCRFRR